MRRITTAPVTTLVLVMAPVLVALALHGHSLSFGLYYDDYIVFRPWTVGELASVWHGTWDPTGAQPANFRPLISTIEAALFALFGWHTSLLHAWVIGLNGIAGNAIALIVRREGGSPRLAALAGVAFVVHPTMAASGSVWVSVGNVHLISILMWAWLVVIWQRCRTGDDAAWRALVLPTVAATLVKEDLYLVVPTLLTVQAARAKLAADLPMPSRRLLVVAMGLLVLGFCLRTWLLGQFSGYEMPDALTILENLSRGPRHAFAWFSGPALPARLGGAFVSLTSAGGVYLLRRSGPAAWQSVEGRLVILGLATVAFMTIGIFMAAQEPRLHFMAVGGGLITAAGMSRIWKVSPMHLRRPLAGAFVVGLALLAADSWYIDRAIAPCSENDLNASQEIREVPGVPPDLVSWLEAVESRCAAGTLAPIGDSVAPRPWPRRD